MRLSLPVDLVERNTTDATSIIDDAAGNFTVSRCPLVAPIEIHRAEYRRWCISADALLTVRCGSSPPHCKTRLSQVRYSLPALAPGDSFRRHRIKYDPTLFHVRKSRDYNHVTLSRCLTWAAFFRVCISPRNFGASENAVEYCTRLFNSPPQRKRLTHSSGKRQAVGFDSHRRMTKFPTY